MLVKTFSAIVQGLQATAVTIEVNATRGIRFVLVGLPDSAVKESHERILAAIENSGYSFPMRAITINLAPAYGDWHLGDRRQRGHPSAEPLHDRGRT